MQMYCSKCGNEIATDSLFCGKCGTQVNINSSFDKEEHLTSNEEELRIKNALAEFKNTKATTCLHCGHVGLMGVGEMSGKTAIITLSCVALAILMGYSTDNKMAVFIMLIWAGYFGRIKQLHCVKCGGKFQADVFGRTKKVK